MSHSRDPAINSTCRRSEPHTIRVSSTPDNRRTIVFVIAEVSGYFVVKIVVNASSSGPAFNVAIIAPGDEPSEIRCPLVKGS